MPVDLPSLLARLGETAALQEEQLKTVAVTVTSVQEELGAEGETVHALEIVSRFTFVDGVQREEVLLAKSDGHEATEQARAQRAANPASGSGGTPSPFLPRMQAQHVFSLETPEPDPEGRVRIAFSPRVPGPGAIEGVATVDAASAELRALDTSPSPLPEHVAAMRLSFTFATPSPWGLLLTEARFEAKAKVLFFSKKLRGHSRFEYALPT